MLTGNLILVAEDDENDIVLVQRACRKANVTARLEIVHDGVEALDYLLGRGPYGDREKYPLPYLVLLDIKMPRMNGLQVLERVKNDAAARRIPIVVTSSSNLQTDIDAAYDLGANAYLCKPVDFETLLRTFQLVAEFFTKHAARPQIKSAH